MDYALLKEFTDEALATENLRAERMFDNGKKLVCEGYIFLEGSRSRVRWWFYLDGQAIDHSHALRFLTNTCQLS